jgi:hypothetical protein
VAHSQGIGTHVMSLDQIGQIAVVLSVVVLAAQARALRTQVARSEMQTVYGRYLEITKIEIENPLLHRMFLYGNDFARLSQLSPEELHQRALSLLVFDQFALIFNMSKRSFGTRIGWWLVEHVPPISRSRSVRRFLDHRRTIFEINADYINGVLTNPLLIQAWKDWGLGGTWAGSEFYDFVEKIIADWTRERECSDRLSPENQPDP